MNRKDFIQQINFIASGIILSPLPNGNESTLHFPKIVAGTENIWLRLTAAIDFREEITVAAILPKSKKEIGVLDIRFAHPFQPFEIPVNTDYLDSYI